MESPGQTIQPHAPSRTGQGQVRTRLTGSTKILQVTLHIVNLLTRLALLVLLLTFIDCDQLGRLASRIDSVGTATFGEQWGRVTVMLIIFGWLIWSIAAGPHTRPDQAVRRVSGEQVPSDGTRDNYNRVGEP